MYPFSCGFLCERDILLVRDREEDMETDRYVFFDVQDFFSSDIFILQASKVLRYIPYSPTPVVIRGKQ